MKSMNIHRVSIALLVTAFAVSIGMVCSGCSRDDAGTPPENEVWIQGSAFKPADMVIAQGTTVTWTNKNPAVHTVISGAPGTPAGIFDSGSLSENSTFSFTFDMIGTFDYYCRNHPSMTATIAVQ